jgi:hypothetical protein
MCYNLIDYLIVVQTEECKIYFANSKTEIILFDAKQVLPVIISELTHLMRKGDEQG